MRTNLINENTRTDVHCHLLGNCIDINVALKNEDIYYNPYDNPTDLSSLFIKNVVIQDISNNIKKKGGKISKAGISSKDYIDFIYKLFVESTELDALVLLAMDAVFSKKTNQLQEKETDLFISNQYLYKKVNELNQRLIADGFKNKKFLFGASVNPNRDNWKEELTYVCEDTNAVLLKLIPSVHDVELWDPKHEPFYQKLIDNELPLLCHVGPELAFAQGINNKSLDEYKNLRRPLECGVKVIAAHLASPFFPGEENKILHFVNFMKEFNKDGDIKLWADISAVTTSFRVLYMRHFVQNFPPSWLVNGSDMPVPIEPKTHLPIITYGVTPDEYFNFINEKNLFDMDIKIKKAHGFSNSIFTNAYKVLR